VVHYTTFRSHIHSVIFVPNVTRIRQLFLKLSLVVGWYSFFRHSVVPCGTDGRLLLSGFQALVIVGLDLESGHTAYRRAVVIDFYLNTKFHWNRKTFCGRTITAGVPPSSRSRDTKTNTNGKNVARSNLDIVL